MKKWPQCLCKMDSFSLGWLCWLLKAEAKYSNTLPSDCVIRLNSTLPLGHGWLISLQDLISRVQHLARWGRSDFITNAFAYAGILECTYYNLDTHFCRDTITNQTHLTLVPCTYSSNRSLFNISDSSFRLSIQNLFWPLIIHGTMTYLLDIRNPLLLKKLPMLETAALHRFSPSRAVTGPLISHFASHRRSLKNGWKTLSSSSVYCRSSSQSVRNRWLCCGWKTSTTCSFEPLLFNCFLSA